MRKRIVIAGFLLIIAAFAVLMTFDSELGLMTIGSAATSRQPTGISVVGVAYTTYLRLSAYLIGIAGLMIASLGILLEPKIRRSSKDSEDLGRLDEVSPSSEPNISSHEKPMSTFERDDKSRKEQHGHCRMLNRRVVIRLDSVVKTYTGDGVATPALREVSLKIFEGNLVAIVGPSGCGKSTLLHMIGALDKPTSGKIFIDDIDISKLNDRELAELRNRKIGFIFQSFNLIPRMTALSNVEFPLAARNISSRRRSQMALKTLQLVGLGDKAYRVPSKLSGGEQQRVAVARSLVTEPAILVGDEPTGNLDTKNTRAIVEMLSHLNKGIGKTIVIVTHNMEVAAVADRIIHLRDGLIEREESVDGGN